MRIHLYLEAFLLNISLPQLAKKFITQLKYQILYWTWLWFALNAFVSEHFTCHAKIKQNVQKLYILGYK